MAAPHRRLKEGKGVGDAVIDEIKIVHAAASRVARGQAQNRLVLSSWGSVLDDCRTAQAFAHKQQFGMLFLDKRSQLIANEPQQTPTPSTTPRSIREK